MNVFNKDERFYFFLLESLKRSITRQSAFERFKTQIFFCSAKIKDRWLPVPLLLPLPPQNSKQHGSTVNTAASGCGGNCSPGGIWSWLGLPKGVPLSPTLSFPLLSSPLLSSPLLSASPPFHPLPLPLPLLHPLPPFHPAGKDRYTFIRRSPTKRHVGGTT